MLGLSAQEIEHRIRQATAAEMAPIIQLLRETNEYLAAIYEHLLLQDAVNGADSGS